MKRDQAWLYTLLLLCIVGLNTHAVEWPQWRGPEGDGTTTAEINPGFANGGIEPTWTADLGVGFSGVTVADGKAYTAGWKDGNTIFYCFDANNGKEIWSHAFPTEKFANLNVGGPRGSAVVDAGHVYHIAGGGEMHCYNASNGKIVWKKNLSKEYGIKPPRWGFSGSPVVIGDVVYVDIGRTLALDKKSGNEIWKTDNFGAAYSSPAPFTYQNKAYLAVFPGSGLYIVERETGKKIAHHPWKTSYDVHAATPVIVGSNIFISSDYNTGCALLGFDGKSLNVRWENKNLKNQMCTSLYHDGYFYGFNSAKLTCIDAKTGEEKWNQRGLGKGTVIMAANQTLVVLSDKGEVQIGKASPDGFKPTSKAKLINGDQTIWTAPTLANGKLYVRGSKGKLVCIDVSP